MKPASKSFGSRGIFIRGELFKNMVANTAFKRVQLDVRVHGSDAGEPHRGFAFRTGRTMYGREGDGREMLRLSQGAPLQNTGGSTTLSVTGKSLDTER